MNCLYTRAQQPASLAVGVFVCGTCWLCCDDGCVVHGSMECEQVAHVHALVMSLCYTHDTAHCREIALEHSPSLTSPQSDRWLLPLLRHHRSLAACWNTDTRPSILPVDHPFKNGQFKLQIHPRITLSIIYMYRHAPLLKTFHLTRTQSPIPPVCRRSCELDHCTCRSPTVRYPSTS